MARVDYIPSIDIPDVTTHLSCPCYRTGERQLIRQYLFTAGETYSNSLKTHTILCILTGAIRFRVPDRSAWRTIGSGEFIFLPVGAKMEYEALESGSMLTFGLGKTIGNIPECHTFRLNRAGHSPSEVDRTGFWPLRANDRIRHFLDGTLASGRDGLKCITYARLLISQLMFLIQIYYPQDDYTRFYAPLLSPDVALSDFVYKNYNKYATVKEFAEALGLSTRQFSTRFLKVFGESPGSWIQKAKASDIYYEICKSHKTLKAIAMEHNFSMSNFIRFCRTNFGRSPGAIRQQLVTNNGQEASDKPSYGMCKRE